MSFTIESIIWAIFFIPLISFILCLFKFKVGESRIAGLITVFSIGASFILSLYSFIKILSDTRTAIKQIRVLGAFILQPEMKLLKIVPDPR